MRHQAKTLWILLFLCLSLAVPVAAGCGDDDDDDSGDDDSGDDDNDTSDDDDDDTGDDDTGGDDDDDDLEPLVFVQFTDIHQSRGSDSSKGRYENWFKSLQYTHDVIDPDFVVATGDLTDGSADKGQSQLDWDDYQNAIIDAGYDQERYHDVPGNHDSQGDSGFSYYLANGISGVLMHAWDIEKSGHHYSFFGLLTAHSRGIEGEFTQDSYDWLAPQLQAANDDTHIFLFAHHNSILSPDVGLMGNNGLIDQYDVTAFTAGHRHIDLEITQQDARFLKTAHHYKGMSSSDDGWMRLFVVTGTTWATKTSYVVDRGPQVIITVPQDKRLAVARNPEGHRVTGATLISAMAFGEGEISLQIKLDDQPLTAMNTDDGQTFYYEYDFSTLTVGAHIIRVEDPDRDDKTNGVDVIEIESY